MNDKHDDFLARGETVYIGKVDSVRALPGRERLLLKYWLSDPRAKTLTLTWGTNNANSRVLTIDPHNPSDELEVSFEGENALSEGNYTFNWVSMDDHGNKSMVLETLASVYGPLYQEKLLNRRVTETNINDGGDILVTWAGSSSEEEIGVELFYTNRSGEPVTEFYTSFLNNQLTMDDADYTKGVSYRTLYKPDPNAIDTFYTDIISMDITKIVNVSVGKPVTVGSVHQDNPASFGGENAVDGNYATSAPRWISGDADGTHWIEIDLQGEYAVNGFMSWNGNGNYTSYPLSDITLSVWDGTDWVRVFSVTGNTEGIVGGNFNSVTTEKVKFESASKTRIYEIEIYSIIRY